MSAGEAWIVLVEDRHSDVDAMPFSSEERAIGYARTVAEQNDAAGEDLTPGMRQDGWVFYAPYGSEGDCIRVVKRTLDASPSS